MDLDSYPGNPLPVTHVVSVAPRTNPGSPRLFSDGSTWCLWLLILIHGCVEFGRHGSALVCPCKVGHHLRRPPRLLLHPFPSEAEVLRFPSRHPLLAVSQDFSGEYQAEINPEESSTNKMAASHWLTVESLLTATI